MEQVYVNKTYKLIKTMYMELGCHSLGTNSYPSNLLQLIQKQYSLSNFFKIHYSFPNLRILDARVFTIIIPWNFLVSHVPLFFLPFFPSTLPSSFFFFLFLINFWQAHPPWLSQLFPFSVFKLSSWMLPEKIFLVVSF